MIRSDKALRACCRRSDAAVGHPLAGNRAHRSIATHPLHIERELTVGLTSALREAHATAVLIPRNR